MQKHNTAYHLSNLYNGIALCKAVLREADIRIPTVSAELFLQPSNHSRNHLPDTNNKKVVEKPKEDIYVKAAKEKLQEFFQTSVSISKNSISIHYENKEDLNRVLELLNLVEEE